VQIVVTQYRVRADTQQFCAVREMLYGTGGLGYANTRYSALTFAAGLPSAGATGVFNTDRWGYAAGAGIAASPRIGAPSLSICITALIR
jgi:hypothetical protein